MCQTEEQKQGSIQRAKDHPIWGTDFNDPVSKIIENLRHELTKVRGGLNDICSAFPHYRQRLESVQGLLTCGLITMYGEMNEILQREIEKDDRDIGESLEFRSRGIGLDMCPSCFVCGTEKRNEDSNMYLNNISAFTTREQGKRLYAWFDESGRVDFRESEPDWVQFKIGACDEHKPNLETLHQLTSYQGRIRKRDIELAKNS
jgi:hypothetical protein